MKLKSIKIGKFETENNVFLAPLAGFSDYAMRSVCLSYGAGLTFTEMVSCKGLLYDNEIFSTLLPRKKLNAYRYSEMIPELCAARSNRTRLRLSI